MRTRIILFRRTAETSATHVHFGVQGTSLLQTITAPNLDELARLNNWSRHPKFDWAVGDAGSKSALFEAPIAWNKPNFLGVDAAPGVTWLTFPEAARFLTEGEDRRLLQLAVQYVAQGGVDDSVLATDYDKEFLETLKRELERRSLNDFSGRKE